MGAGGRWQVPRVKVVYIRKSSFVRERRRGSGVENECLVWHPRNDGTTHTMLPSHHATPRHALALSLSEIGREMWCGERGRACTAVGEPLLKVFLGKQDGRERKPRPTDRLSPQIPLPRTRKALSVISLPRGDQNNFAGQAITSSDSFDPLPPTSLKIFTAKHCKFILGLFAFWGAYVLQGGPSASGKKYVDTKFEVAFNC